jgi:cellulose synthase/poly-beta-1,6-N-acetylglucosamine synthase-like glycosyltransferase
MIFLLMFTTLFCLLVPFYVYVGYPLLLWMLVQIKPALTHRREEITPPVTLIVSCYNEAPVIAEKLDNALSLDYPKDQLRIIAVSDGSDDGTDAIIKGYEAQGVQLIRQEGRLGKTMGLNLAMEQVSGDIVVFSDANAMYEADAIRKLVRNFADDEVGYVVGAALYTDGKEGASAHNENLYWRYELAIKAMESRLHSVVGGDGAIYAIRSALWEPLQQRDINDFVNPLQIVAKGYRGIFEPEAKCYEETAGSFDKEIARKERIVNRSIRGLMRVKSVMDPRVTGIFALEVISHKLLRWLIPLFLGLGVVGSSLLGALGYDFFQLVVAGALLLTLLAAIAHRSDQSNELPVYLSLPYYFIMVNAFAVRGITKAILGETQVTWNSAREGSTNSQGSTSGMATRWFYLALAGMALSLSAAVIF